jgi:hypothetical protein
MENVPNEIDSAKDELVREAAVSGNQICRLKNGSNFFIKAKHGYSHPEELRILYVRAFDSLVKEEKFRLVFSNSDLDLYELTCADSQVCSGEDAKADLLGEIRRSGSVFKIHGKNCEYVQVGNRAIDKIEGERIVYLQALGELVRSGEIRPVLDNSVLAKFVIGWAKYPLADAPLMELVVPQAQAA